MVSRAPPENDWLGRIFLPLFSAFLSLCMAGIVFYFSSQRSTLDALQAQISATSEAVHMLKQQMEMNDARRDDRLNELAARLERRR